MMDMVLVAVVLAFFGLCFAYSSACNRLWRRHPWSSITRSAVQWRSFWPSISPMLSSAPNAS